MWNPPPPSPHSDPHNSKVTVISRLHYYASYNFIRGNSVYKRTLHYLQYYFYATCNLLILRARLHGEVQPRLKFQPG